MKVRVYSTSFEVRWRVVGTLVEEVCVWDAVVTNNCELDGTAEIIGSDTLFVLEALDISVVIAAGLEVIAICEAGGFAESQALHLVVAALFSVFEAMAICDDGGSALVTVASWAVLLVITICETGAIAQTSHPETIELPSIEIVPSLPQRGS